jgi:hypothetical protein
LRAGLRPESLSPPPAGPSHTSPDAAPGSPERDLAAVPLSSPACICQDRFSPEITQDSTPECDVTESSEVAQGSTSECDAAEIQSRILEQGGRTTVSGTSEFVKSADIQCRAELYPRLTSSASDFVCTGERPSFSAAPVSVADGGKNLQGQLLLEDKHQPQLGGALGFAGERPKPPEFKSARDPASLVTFQHC